MAVKEKVSASNQNQALCSILFLYKQVLGIDLGEFQGIRWSKKPKKLPVVFTRKEVKYILNNLNGLHRTMATLLYGSGLRLTECLQLRIKDIDLEYKQIIVRDGKGKKDRVTMLPESIETDLKLQIDRVKKLHEKDLRDGYGAVYLPDALEKNSERS